MTYRSLLDLLEEERDIAKELNDLSRKKSKEKDNYKWFNIVDRMQSMEIELKNVRNEIKEYFQEN